MWAVGAGWVDAIETAVTAFFAVWSLNAWRRQISSARRFELAEEAIAGFHEARAIFRWVRPPSSFGGEVEGREGRDEEPEAERNVRNRYDVTMKRLEKENEFFMRMQAQHFRAMVIIGEDVEKFYKELREIENIIRFTAKVIRDQDFKTAGGMRAKVEAKDRETLVDVGGKSPNEVRDRIDKLVNDVQARLRPELLYNRLKRKS